jgi:hypothetical protein
MKTKENEPLDNEEGFTEEEQALLAKVGFNCLLEKLDEDVTQGIKAGDCIVMDTVRLVIEGDIFDQSEMERVETLHQLFHTYARVIASSEVIRFTLMTQLRSIGLSDEAAGSAVDCAFGTSADMTERTLIDGLDRLFEAHAASFIAEHLKPSTDPSEVN